jgi:L-ascorbate metabolism protein UlaG (beta-lactamase superfamily)
MSNLNQKTIVGIIATVVIVVALYQYSQNQVTSSFDNSGFVEGAINVTLLENAGIMVEASNGLRIYVDPINLPHSFRDLPADAILITHDHGDHYQASTVNMLQKEGTVNVLPAIMLSEIEQHDGVGVVPEDEVIIGDVTITAYYMYTYAPTPTIEASHPRESQFTSYIIDVGGFTIFHAGDSKNLDEYEELKGMINVACLPLGPGCQTMADEEIITVLDVIEPDYFIPIHFQEGANDQFCIRFRSSIEAVADCVVCNLDHYSTHAFDTG